jgi:hypothetical protein
MMKAQKTAHYVLWTLTSVLLTGVLMTGSVSARETIQLVGFNYAPYYSDAYLENKGHGFVSDLVTAAFDAVDVEAVITISRLPGVLKALKRGGLWHMSAARKRFYHSSAPTRWIF